MKLLWRKKEKSDTRVEPKQVLYWNGVTNPTYIQNYKSNRNKCCIEINVFEMNTILSQSRTETSVVLKLDYVEYLDDKNISRTETSVVLKFKIINFIFVWIDSRTETSVVLKCSR